MRWRTELSSFDFDIVCRCGEKNIPADALSRVKYLSMSTGKLRDVHFLFVTQKRHEWLIL